MSDFLTNDDLTRTHLPSSEASMDVLCKFAATFDYDAIPQAEDESLPALTFLRRRLFGLYRLCYHSLHQSPEEYRARMLRVMDHIRRVLQERDEAHPACVRVRQFCQASRRRNFMIAWTSLVKDNPDGQQVEVCFVIPRLPGIVYHVRTFVVSGPLSDVRELDAE